LGVTQGSRFPLYIFCAELVSVSLHYFIYS
jgi:hypothetical protein